MLSAFVPAGLPVTGITAQAVVRFAAAAVAATLAVSSARNMCQTYYVCTKTLHPGDGAPTSSNSKPDRENVVRLVHDDDEMLCQMEKGESPSSAPPMTRTEHIVTQLQKMNRKKLLQLYMDPTRCSAPIRSLAPVPNLEGEWEGVLLENRGTIMTWVTHLITHRFFAAAAAAATSGRNAMILPWRAPPFSWRGKSFSRMDGDGIITGGANRLAAARGGRGGDGSSSSAVVHRHKFDVVVGKTRFPLTRRRQQHQGSALKEDEVGHCDTSGNDLAMILVYRRHHSWYSLWKTMTDELRVVRVPSTTVVPSEPTVLLGWGCMAWSGGILNASPFLLYRTPRDRPWYLGTFGL